MKEICDKNKCTGCRACELICPNKCISMEYDAEGFLYPLIDEKICSGCGLCEKTCSYEQKSLINRNAYIAYTHDRMLINRSSSGGIYGEIARAILSAGGVVYGVEWDDSMNAKFKRVTSDKELLSTCGSKYVQSDVGHVYIDVERDLNEGKEVLFSGTPCQINGIFKYLKKEYKNLITCAVICHGVPSPKIWNHYVRYIEGKYNSKICKVSFRDKEDEGWKNSHIIFDMETRTVNLRQDEDIYFKAFLQNLILRPSCYSCEGEYKYLKSDIVLGDYWGIENERNDINVYRGVSAVVANSDKAVNVINRLAASCFLSESDIDNITKYNPALKYSALRNNNRNKFFDEYTVTNNIEDSIKRYLKWEPTKENRAIQMYPVIKRYFLENLNGWNVCEFLKKIGASSVALYAITELTEIVYYDLINHGYNMDMVYIGDKARYGEYEPYEFEKEIVSAEKVVDLYNKNEINAIIICSMTHKKEITNFFIEQGIDIDKIYNVSDVVYKNFTM